MGVREQALAYAETIQARWAGSFWRSRGVIVAFAVGLTLLLPTAASASYTMVNKWGSQGRGNGQFDGGPAPTQYVATDAAGNVYVTDTYNDRVQKFTANGSFITKWGTTGSGPGQFARFEGPSGIAVDKSGNVYVGDYGNDRVEKFTSNGAFLGSWGPLGRGEFDHGPEGIATDAAGNVYVAEEGPDEVQKYTSNGVFITSWGGPGSHTGQFFSPRGIAVDRFGNVYVADNHNDRLQKFTANGAFVQAWGTSGSGSGQFDHPYGVAADTAGNVYVVDRENRRVQKFNGSGTFIAKWGRYGVRDGEFADPEGIAVGPNGHVYVVDSALSQVQAFANLPPAPDTRITKAKIAKRRGRARFEFTSTGVASGFQCSLLKGGNHRARFRTCKSPKTYKHLEPGSYTFAVMAIGPGGKDPSPAKKPFRIKAKGRRG